MFLHTELLCDDIMLLYLLWRNLNQEEPNTKPHLNPNTADLKAVMGVTVK